MKTIKKVQKTSYTKNGNLKIFFYSTFENYYLHKDNLKKIDLEIGSTYEINYTESTFENNEGITISGRWINNAVKIKDEMENDAIEQNIPKQIEVKLPENPRFLDEPKPKNQQPDTETIKTRSTAISYAKDLFISGKIQDPREMFIVAEKIVDFIEDKIPF